MTVTTLPHQPAHPRREPPEGLEPPEVAAWRSISAAYRIEDEAGRELLRVYLQNRGLARKCREAITAEGLQVGGRAHPLLKILDAAERRALATLRDLHLDLEPLRDAPGRPPGHGGGR